MKNDYVFTVSGPGKVRVYVDKGKVCHTFTPEPPRDELMELLTGAEPEPEQAPGPGNE